MDDTGCTIREFEHHYGESPDRPDIQGILIPGRRGRLLAALYTAAGPGPLQRCCCSTVSQDVREILIWLRSFAGQGSTCWSSITAAAGVAMGIIH